MTDRYLIRIERYPYGRAGIEGVEWRVHATDDAGRLVYPYVTVVEMIVGTLEVEA